MGSTMCILGYALNFEQPTVTISVANKHKNLAQDQNLASACFMLNQQTSLGRISTLRGELEMVSSLPLSFFAARREGGGLITFTPAAVSC
jgi:hypothetical protein